MSNQDFEAELTPTSSGDVPEPAEPSVASGGRIFGEQDKQSQLRVAALELVFGRSKANVPETSEPAIAPKDQQEAQSPSKAGSVSEHGLVASALTKITKPKAKPRTPTMAELREIRQIYGKILSVGKLLIPEVDLRDSNLGNRIVRIINQADLNLLTKQSLAGHQITPTELRISAKGKTYAHKEPFVLDIPTRRVVNQLLIAYLDRQLELKALYELCGFGATEGAENQDQSLQALHNTLVYLKHKKIVTYQGGLVSLYPTIIKDERVTLPNTA